jgi:hypothetical protein
VAAVKAVQMKICEGTVFDVKISRLLFILLLFFECFDNTAKTDELVAVVSVK